MKGEKIEQNGFAFSIPELIAIINRKDALEEARFYQKNHWDRTNPYPKAA